MKELLHIIYNKGYVWVSFHMGIRNLVFVYIPESWGDITTWTGKANLQNPWGNYPRRHMISPYVVETVVKTVPTEIKA